MPTVQPRPRSSAVASFSLRRRDSMWPTTSATLLLSSSNYTMWGARRCAWGQSAPPAAALEGADPTCPTQPHGQTHLRLPPLGLGLELHPQLLGLLDGVLAVGLQPPCVEGKVGDKHAGSRLPRNNWHA